MDDLAERHLDLAHIIASKTLRGCPPQITFDDLCSAAYLGLVQAARIYDPDRGVPFRAFASWRIKGAVVDELRGHEVVSRQDRRHIREVDAFEQSFTASVGRRRQLRRSPMVSTCRWTGSRPSVTPARSARSVSTTPTR